MGFALEASVKPVWRVIYNNDGTNILNCASPYNTLGQRVLTEEKVRASVREAAVAGVGAQLLSPGTSWVPWWPSRVVPLAQHVQWFESRYGVKPASGELQFLLDGGDIIGAFIDECHKHKVAALVSFRANDGHLIENAFAKKVKGQYAGHLSQFYAQHPQFRRSQSPAQDWGERVHNWAIPEARAYKEALLAELIQTYPQLDGVEIDFQRHPQYFPDDMPANERVAVMVDFLKKARAQLDLAAQKTDGKHRSLGVRVPKWPENSHPKLGSWETVGFDAAAWAAAGVDFFNLSTNYSTDLDFSSIAQVRAGAPEAAIYAELTHTPLTWDFSTQKNKYSSTVAYRRATKEVLETTAREAYARGADGVSIFNFAYYRAFGGNLDLRGPFDEPPFEALSALADLSALEKLPVCYFYRKGVGRAFKPNKKTAPAKLTLDITPAQGNGAATLRLLLLTHAELTHHERDKPQTVDHGTWKVSVNGQVLSPQPAAEAQVPPIPFKAGNANPQQYQFFALPPGVLKQGENEILVEAQAIAQDMYLRWLDITQTAR